MQRTASRAPIAQPRAVRGTATRLARPVLAAVKPLLTTARTVLPRPDLGIPPSELLPPVGALEPPLARLPVVAGPDADHTSVPAAALAPAHAPPSRVGAGRTLLAALPPTILPRPSARSGEVEAAAGLAGLALTLGLRVSASGTAGTGSAPTGGAALAAHHVTARLRFAYAKPGTARRVTPRALVRRPGFSPD